MSIDTDTIETDEVIDPKLEEKKSLTVLRRKMHFYDNQAKELLADIILLLKEQAKRPDLMAHMYKKLSEADAIAIDCAFKLAAFEFPKLQTVEQKGEVTHKFVVRAPAAMENSKDWLNAIPTPKPLELRANLIERE